MIKNRVYKDSNYGYEVKLNYVANQTNGSVWFTHGETVLLVVAVKEDVESFPGFFPLSVDHRELFSAAGKIPGGYFKREGKPTDKEVLISRIIDRILRPLFPYNYFDKIQIMSTVYSIDSEHLPASFAVLSASLALCISNIPFLEPAGCCEVVKVDGEWKINPTHEQASKSTARLMVGGTFDGINMVEGSFEGLGEDEVIETLFLAHEEIKKQIIFQRNIISDLKIEKTQVKNKFDASLFEDEAKKFLTPDRVESIFLADKVSRSKNQSALSEGFLEQVAALIEETKLEKSFVLYSFDSVLQEKMTEHIFAKKARIDGRDFDTVRQISSEVGLLPRNHGSALFTRGRTQLLASATLGSQDDALNIETLIEEKNIPFMLHYNFLPFSVGEAKPLRATGRREVGHGYLAFNAIKAILPDHETFPYTMRIVADTLESDGSTSMATVCSGCLALMDAGVPLKDMVAGIAMGMLQDSAGQFHVITDIAGIEDSFGLMDFKIAGTADKVTAMQMDIKYKGGLSKEIFKTAFEKAKRARLHILSIMKQTLSEPKKELSKYVPQVVAFKINKDKIGAVIGSGGKVIKDITSKTDTSIEILDDGLVKIFGHPGELLDKAVAWVKTIAGEIQAGTEYFGTVKKVAEFGYFVELVPGVDGLVHISSVKKNDVDEFKKRYKENDKVKVVVLEYDVLSNRIRLKIVE